MWCNSGRISMTDGTRKKFVRKQDVDYYRERGWWRGIPLHVIDQLEEMHKAKIKEVPEMLSIAQEKRNHQEAIGKEFYKCLNLSKALSDMVSDKLTEVHFRIINTGHVCVTCYEYREQAEYFLVTEYTFDKDGNLIYVNQQEDR